MSTVENNRYHLTSKAVQPSPYGNYPFHVAEYLMPHEALRREMIRAQKALDSTSNLVEHPWKFQAFAKWFLEFFAPAVHEHHHIEETVVVPFYKNLEADVPMKANEDHALILEHLEDMVKKVQEIQSLLLSHPTSRHSTLLLGNLRDEFRSFHTFINDHFAEEETLWPPVYEKFGKKAADQCLQKILAAGSKHPVFQVMAGSVFNAMGLKIGGIEPCYPGEKGWACQEMQDEALASMPYPVRALLLPSWNKKYQQYKRIITMIAENRYDPQLMVDHYSVNCVVN